MTAIDILRNQLIDKILTISDKDYLTELTKSVEHNSSYSGKVAFTEEQQLMLQLSETDISNGKLISQADLDKSDLEWLSEI